ncbi:MAG: DUF934 domain-containing protein [Geminicoccales bacterium]
MPLLKDGVAVDDPWRALGDEEPLPPDAPVIVSIGHWQAEREALIAREAPFGIRLSSDQPLSLIADDVHRFGVIALEFPHFKDGRAYSQARLLRERFGYGNELRAVGQLLRDQFLFMARCGFDAYEVKDEGAVEGWRAAMREFTVFYQSAADRRVPAFVLRHRSRAAAE